MVQAKLKKYIYMEHKSRQDYICVYIIFGKRSIQINLSTIYDGFTLSAKHFTGMAFETIHFLEFHNGRNHMY